MTTKKVIEVTEIRSRTAVRNGITYIGDVAEGHKATIVPGESIVLHGEHRGVPYRREFKIGDTAEYDSFNLSYLGSIVAITEKTVSIKDKHERKTYRLPLHTFDWRNYDLDLEATAAHNARTWDYI